MLEVTLRIEGVSGRGASVCKLFCWIPVVELQSKRRPGVSRLLGDALSAKGLLASSKSSSADIDTRHAIRTQQWLYNAQNLVQLPLDIFILGLHNLLLTYDILKILVGLLRSQLLNLSLQRLNLPFRPLPDRSLSFTVICTLLGQLLRSEVGYSSRSRG